MLTTEPREDESCINIVSRSGASTRDSKGKKKVEETWVRNTIEKALGFIIHEEK